MGRRTVVPGLLVCVAISVTGCGAARFRLDQNSDTGGWFGIVGEGKLGRREFRARERYLEQTQPERFAQMRRRRNTGICLGVLGGVGLGYGVLLMGGGQVLFMASEPPDDDEIDVGADVAIAGGISLVIGAVMARQYRPYVQKKGRRPRGQLLIGPNGCALAYRF